MRKFEVQIVERYRRYIEIEAEDKDEAYDIITTKVESGEIDLPRDGSDYKYDRELFIEDL